MSESSRQALVVPVELREHANADSLSVVYIDGFTVVVKTALWNDFDRGVYIQPETLVPTDRPEFAFLAKAGRDKYRLSAQRLRGVWSLGLLIRVSKDFEIGTDMWEALGLEHYEPPEHSGFYGHQIPFEGAAEAPPFWQQMSKYDVDNLRKWPRAFEEGELVNVTEKYHGTNCGFVFSDGRFHARSRSFWRPDTDQIYWSTFNERIRAWCEANPDHIVYGEIVGAIQQGFRYGVPSGEIAFRAFDVLKPDRTFMEVERFQDQMHRADIQTVKIVGPEFTHYDFDQIAELAEGRTLENANHIREGVVVRPMNERYVRGIGRLILKMVSNKYLERSKESDPTPSESQV